MKKETWILKRDGKEVFRGTYIECVRYTHWECPSSFDHALKYEGYSIKAMADEGQGNEDNKS